MRIGIGVGDIGGRPGTVDEVVEQVRQARADGFSSAWMAQIFGLDALTTLAVVGREVPDIELGTGVVPTYPRHPMVLAGQALTVQAASGGRLVLGIGLSHQLVVEGMWGYSYDKPARHMREYLDALLPLLRGENVSVDGETLKAMGQVQVANADPCPVLLAALAPRMLRLAGEVADGTVTWMTGPATVTDHVVPSITAAAEKAERPAPRVVVGLPICVTDDVDAARERAARIFVMYGSLPSYRAMLDREGAEGPADVAIVGDEQTVGAALDRLADGGATDFLAAPFGSRDDRGRTMQLLAARARTGP